MNVKVPAPDFWDAHIMTRQFCGLDVPQDIFAVRVLVSNFY